MRQTRHIGEVLHFKPDAMYLLVVLTTDSGIRCIDPNNLKFDRKGNIITYYIPNEALKDYSTSHGTVQELAELSDFVSKKFGTSS